MRYAHAREDGQAAIEFALVLPVLLLLVVSVFEFGKAWSIRQQLTETSRNAVRLAVVADISITEDSVRSMIVEELLGASLDTGNAVVTLGMQPNTGTPDTVTIAYPYQFKFLGRLLQWASGADSISITAQSVMRNE